MDRTSLTGHLIAYLHIRLKLKQDRTTSPEKQQKSLEQV